MSTRVLVWNALVARVHEVTPEPVDAGGERAEDTRAEGEDARAGPAGPGGDGAARKTVDLEVVAGARMR
jgi:hypothetical protein